MQPPHRVFEYQLVLGSPSQGRDYYQKKLAEGKTSKEAIRALKRRISDVVYRQLRADARRHIG
jgi:hypothetical protein